MGERELGYNWDLGFFRECYYALLHLPIFIVRFFRCRLGGKEFAELCKFLCSLCVLVI